MPKFCPVKITVATIANWCVASYCLVLKKKHILGLHTAQVPPDDLPFNIVSDHIDFEGIVYRHQRFIIFVGIGPDGSTERGPYLEVSNVGMPGDVQNTCSFFVVSQVLALISLKSSYYNYLFSLQCWGSFAGLLKTTTRVAKGAYLEFIFTVYYDSTNDLRCCLFCFPQFYKFVVDSLKKK